MAGNNAQYWDPLVMEPTLSPAEKQIRDNFVTEYLKDLNAYAAIIRAGYLSNVAHTYAGMFMQEPYVLREIQNRRSLIPENKKKVRKQNEHDLEQLLWELARDKGAGSSHSARVSAASKLVNMYDLEGTTKIKSEVTHKGGIMVVPGIASVEEWEKQASTSQDALISASAEDRGVRPLH